MGNQTVQSTEPAGFLESNLPLVESVVGEIGRRHRVRGDAFGEFRSLAFLKLVEHDYAVLRRFEGASSLRTYLTVVLQRVLLDYRNREWGRWRASAAASRIGPVAVRLERLVTRDGLTPGEAIAAVKPQGDVTACIEFVKTLPVRQTARGSKAMLGEDAIPEVFDPAPDPEAALEKRQQGEGAAAMRQSVCTALRALDSQDHLIITLRFRDGLSVADTARVLGLEPKPLYRRIDGILARLHQMLTTDGRPGRLARELVRDAWCDLLPVGESGWWRPSTPASDIVSDFSRVARQHLPGRRRAGRIHRQVRGYAVRADRAASL